MRFMKSRDFQKKKLISCWCWILKSIRILPSAECQMNTAEADCSPMTAILWAGCLKTIKGVYCEKALCNMPYAYFP